MTFNSGDDLTASSLNTFAPGGNISLLTGKTISWNGDTNIYRGAADQLKTDDTMFALQFKENSGALSASATEGTGGSTSSTSYVAVGATIGTSFVAPQSGKVRIHFATAGFNSGANDNKTSPAVRTGSTVGSGTVVQAAIDDNMILFTGSATYRKAAFMDVSGLTAGTTYNVRLEHRTSAGTMNVLYRIVAVAPLT